jgi:hypothetical protein
MTLRCPRLWLQGGKLALTGVFFSLLLASVQGQGRKESFRVVVTKVRSEVVALHVPASAPASVRSSEHPKLDGFRIWAATKTSTFELTGFDREPMSDDECAKYFSKDTCKMQTIGRPEVGKEYDATRSGRSADLLCLFDPKAKVATGDCYQIEAEETKK